MENLRKNKVASTEKEASLNQIDSFISDEMKAYKNCQLIILIHGIGLIVLGTFLLATLF